MRAEKTLSSLAFVIASGIAACGPTELTEERSTTGGAATTGSSATTNAATTSTGSAETSSTGVPDASTSTGGADETGPPPPPGFLNQLDVPGSSECSIYAQNCPAGQKCIPIANDGGSAWNALACRPIVEQPDAIGESCTVLMGVADGFDTCEARSMCWDVDLDTNEGTCVSFCVGSELVPSCLEPDRACSIGGEPSLALCLPTCNPLLQNCPDGDACYPVEGEHFCAPFAEEGQLGDTCEFLNACGAGYFCAFTEAFCEAEAPSCCHPFCDVSNPACPESLGCVPAYEAGAAPFGLEDVGYCLGS